ncbi:hypothetical protein BOX15_Mlig004581g1 [Macrostomum lignano]|uniref:Importin N-terminal domain-containing protein n=1 Tax=Macrostomum lignano TaxID=282301 RepID=A0A267DP51_9PLAT|nr:hypothetical protein BOX15_Mlig004581g1 [Macrostomum lignano]
MADAARIVQALKATLEAGQQKEAEAYLDEARSTPGFVPGLLSLVMSAELDGPTRQAGAIYLKNTVNRFWRPSGDESDCDNNSTPVFSLSEPDRVHLRATIIEAMLQAPEAILSQLRVCLSAMLQDFPARWGADLPDQLCRAVATENLSLLPGALTAAYTFAKSFQYAKSDQRGPVDETMSRLLPLLLQRLAQADADGPTAFSALVQKLVLKIFYAYTSNYLPPILETNHQLVLLWSEAITRIVRAPVPDECQQGVDPEDRPELCWWKAKKWSMHCLQAWFEKFGPNDDLSKRDASFGDWYVKAVPGTVLQVVFEWLDRYSRGEYLSPKMLYHMLSYLETAVPYAHTWRYIKPHMQEVIARVCFPIMCHSESDAELWESDPVEYVKSKFDVFEEFSSPAVSAQNLIHTASQKRREVLDKCMQFCVEIINRDTTTARELDGALHIVGVVADLLAKKRLYKREIERFLRDKVFPQTRSPHGFLRARSCWLFQRFSEAKLSPEALRQIAELIRMSLVEDKELPVRMEAAIALQDVINDQDEFAEIAKPYVPALLQALLETMRQTGNDELNSVLQKVFLEYREDIGPLAQSIVQQLSDTFIQLLKSTGHNGPDGGGGGGNESGAAGTDEDDEDSAVLAMGILTTLETIASVLEEDSQLMSQLEPIMIGLVRYILSDGIVEYYEEAISLAHSLICERVSDAMWTVLPLLYQCFERDGPDYFNDMMNPLYCYVTVDPDAFLADPSRIDIVLRMCCSVLECGKADEETEYNAAKLLEVMLLHFPGRIDALVPRILQAAVGRVLGDRAPETSELRAMCLLVGVAALLHWPEATLQLLCQQPGLFDRFLAQWISDVDCFLSLHDRKLCVLGFCTLLTCPPDRMPACFAAALPSLLPQFLALFHGLKAAYQLKSRLENEAEDDDDGDGDAEASGEDDNSAVSGDGLNASNGGGKQRGGRRSNGKADADDENKELDSDEDDIDPEQEEYVARLKQLDKAAGGGDNGDDEGDEDDDDEEYEDEDLVNPMYETKLDEDDCELDEYAVFKSTLESLAASQSQVYTQLFGAANEQQRSQLQEVLHMAELRVNARQSKKIGQSGGYTFSQTAVPIAFDFGVGGGGGSAQTFQGFSSGAPRQ